MQEIRTKKFVVFKKQEEIIVFLVMQCLISPPNLAPMAVIIQYFVFTIVLTGTSGPGLRTCQWPTMRTSVNGIQHQYHFQLSVNASRTTMLGPSRPTKESSKLSARSNVAPKITKIGPIVDEALVPIQIPLSHSRAPSGGNSDIVFWQQCCAVQ